MINPHPTLKETHEALLLRVGATQDENAFSILFDYYAPRVKSYLLKHGADNATAEEIVQNTFVTVWEKARLFNPAKAAASTWIFTLARNKRIDGLRRDKYMEIDSDNFALENAVFAPEEPYAEESTLHALQNALKTLPEEQARLLKMAFFEDKTHDAIARETKLPLGTVKSRVRLALEKLRHILKKEGRS